VQDNGGLLIVLLSGLVLGLLLKNSNQNMLIQISILAFSILQILLVIYHLVSLLSRRAQLNHDFWAPSIQLGLVMITIGALLLLFTAIFDLRRKTL